MSAVTPTPRVKLRSSSRRIPRQRAGPGGAVMKADPEPEMRLSRALLVMLLMHIVVIGGIVAFSLIKERNPAPAAPSHPLEAEDGQLPATASNGAAAHRADAGRPNIHVVRPGETLTRIANETGFSLAALVAANSPANVTSGLHAGQELKLPVAGSATATPRPGGAAADALELIEGPAAAGAAAAGGSGTAGSAHLPVDSGKTYIVGKGETPISIAHKLRVSYDALVKLNGIDDPKKLKPGQKLKVPVSTAKPTAKHQT